MFGISLQAAYPNVIFSFFLMPLPFKKDQLRILCLNNCLDIWNLLLNNHFSYFIQLLQTLSFYFTAHGEERNSLLSLVNPPKPFTHSHSPTLTFTAIYVVAVPGLFHVYGGQHTTSALCLPKLPIVQNSGASKDHTAGSKRPK